jgi:light-regulated signal transduction histidine kinase (bacteriophytochrome)
VITKKLIDSRAKDLVAPQMETMDAIRAALIAITQEENRQLALLTEQSTFFFNCGMSLAVSQIVLGLVLLGACRRTITNYTLDDRAKIKALEAEIEQRKKTERALKETTVKLTSSNTDLQQFAYVASHDLQEPLRAVAGFLTLIAKKEKERLDSETEGWINHAVEGAQRMRSLINDLLAYARIESRGKELKETDCNAALAIAKKDLSVVLEETEAQIISEDLPKVLGEQGQLAQLFQNLIGNALKFHDVEKPVVTISVHRKNDDWLFAVKDNGLGFDQSHAERIFVIFQRLQGREVHKGTGIGLSICKKIVERHGGKIWVESAIGKGSTFFFTIPTIQQANDARAI